MTIGGEYLPGEDLASMDDSFEELGVLVPDHPEGGSVTSEHVVICRHVLQNIDQLEESIESIDQ